MASLKMPKLQHLLFRSPGESKEDKDDGSVKNHQKSEISANRVLKDALTIPFTKDSDVKRCLMVLFKAAGDDPLSQSPYRKSHMTPRRRLTASNSHFLSFIYK